MTAPTDKKWFIYVEDHNEGPFSFEEMKSKLEQGLLQADHYVWTEGMADWDVLSSVPQFKPLVNSGGPPAPQADSSTQTMTSDQVLTAPDPAQLSQGLNDAEVLAPAASLGDPTGDSSASISKVSDQSQPTLAKDIAEAGASVGRGAEGEASGEDAVDDSDFEEMDPEELQKLQSLAGPAGSEIEVEQPSLVSKMRVLGRIPAPVRMGAYLVIGLILVGGMIAAFTPGLISGMTRGMGSSIRPLVSGIPVVKDWFAAIPPIVEITPKDYERLRKAAEADLQSQGPQVEMALAEGTAESPVFYVATNLPTGTHFKIALEGVPDTLVQTTESEGTANVEIKDYVGKTGKFNFNGKPKLPRGEYRIFLYEAKNQPPVISELLKTLPDSKVKGPSRNIPKKKIMKYSQRFLGGKKDNIYKRDLTSYHQMIRQRAQLELQELRMVVDTLWNQGKESVKNFKRIGKLKGKNQTSEWASFKQAWAPLTLEIEQKIRSKIENSIQDQYFPNLHRMTSDALALVKNLHSLHDQFFTEPVDKTFFNDSLRNASLLARDKVKELKGQLDEADKMAQDPVGLPFVVKN